MLIKPMTNFKMTIRADCAVFPCNPLSLAVKAIVHLLGRRIWSLDRSLPFPLMAGIQNKANFPLHQPGLYIGFRVARTWTPISVTNIL